jgi:hypothetical protein
MFFVPDVTSGKDGGRGTDMNCNGSVTLVGRLQHVLHPAAERCEAGSVRLGLRWHDSLQLEVFRFSDQRSTRNALAGPDRTRNSGKGKRRES